MKETNIYRDGSQSISARCFPAKSLSWASFLRWFAVSHIHKPGSSVFAVFHVRLLSILNGLVILTWLNFVFVCFLHVAFQERKLGLVDSVGWKGSGILKLCRKGQVLWKYQLWFNEESCLSVASFSPLYVHFRRYKAQNPCKNYMGTLCTFKPLKKMPAPSHLWIYKFFKGYESAL